MICLLENVRCKPAGGRGSLFVPVHGSSSPVYIASDGSGIYCARPIDDTTDTCLLRLTARSPTCDT
jgi:hypothetical protein